MKTTTGVGFAHGPIVQARGLRLRTSSAPLVRLLAGSTTISAPPTRLSA